MLDWLNTKVVMSTAVILMIGTAVAWYDYQDEILNRHELEILLERFVTIVDHVSTSDTFISIEVKSSNNNGTGPFLPATLNGDPYNIILTQKHAKLKLGNDQCSRKFLSRVLLIDNDNKTLEGNILIEEDLDEVTLMKVNSGTDLHIFKIKVASSGIEIPTVIIAPKMIYEHP